jgi:hypothetical protein
VFVPEHAGRCLTPTHDRGPKLCNECSILVLYPLAALDCLKRRGVIAEFIVVRVTGGRHLGYPGRGPASWRGVGFLAKNAVQRSRVPWAGQARPAIPGHRRRNLSLPPAGHAQVEKFGTLTGVGLSARRNPASEPHQAPAQGPVARA